MAMRRLVAEIVVSALQDPRRPQHAHDVRRLPRPEAEGHVGRRERRGGQREFAQAAQAARSDFNPRPGSASVADARGQQGAQRRPARSTLVAPDGDPAGGEASDDIGAAVPVDVAQRQRTNVSAQRIELDVRGLVGPAVADIAIELRTCRRDEEQIDEPVVVVVESCAAVAPVDPGGPSRTTKCSRPSLIANTPGAPALAKKKSV